MLLLLAACASTPIDSADSADTGDAPVFRMRFILTNTSAPGDLATSAGATDIVLAPGLLVVHDADWPVYAEGEAASAGLEALAEDGDPATLAAALEAEAAVRSAQVVSIRDAETYAESPIHPGESASVETPLTAAHRVTFLAMFGQSNDAFVATPPAGLTLDGTEAPALGLGLWDAGTELNQEPGVGSDQAPRQAAANTGADEGGVVHQLASPDDAGWTWPAVADFVTLSAEIVE